jgi:hypothetical protein
MNKVFPHHHPRVPTHPPSQGHDGSPRVRTSVQTPTRLPQRPASTKWCQADRIAGVVSRELHRRGEKAMEDGKKVTVQEKRKGGFNGTRWAQHWQCAAAAPRVVDV